VTGIINKVVPDKDEAARLAREISIMADRHAQELALAQVEMNKEEAAGNWSQASLSSWPAQPVHLLKSNRNAQ
jgi:hypothetical protein